MKHRIDTAARYNNGNSNSKQQQPVQYVRANIISMSPTTMASIQMIKTGKISATQSHTLQQNSNNNHGKHVRYSNSSNHKATSAVVAAATTITVQQQ